MPRSNRPRRGGRRPGSSSGRNGEPDGEVTVAGGPDGLSGLGTGRFESFGAADYAVRSVTGAAAVKTYRCPGCDHEILPGIPHVVAWPLEGPVHLGHAPTDAPGRRHWHTPCWTARTRRTPRR